MTKYAYDTGCSGGAPLQRVESCSYNMFAPKAVQTWDPSAATRARWAGRPSSATLVRATLQEGTEISMIPPAPATRRRISGLGGGAVAAGRRRVHRYHAAEFGKLGCDGSVELLEYAEVGFISLSA